MPYEGHPTDWTLLLEDGSLLSMGRLRGVSHELSAKAERNAAAELLNRIWCDIGAGNDNISLCAHLVRDLATDDLPDPVFRNEFSRRFHRAHYESVIRGRLYTNQWYLSVIVSPRLVPLGSRSFQRQLNRTFYKYRKSTVTNFALASEMEETWALIAGNLSSYDIERIGCRYHGVYNYRFSQIAEAMRTFLGFSGPAPVQGGRISNAIYTDADQPIFERRIFRILPPGCDDDSDDAEGVRWGTIFGLNDYMERVHPDTFDALLSLPMPLVLSQFFGFHAQPSAVEDLSIRRKQMKKTGDRAKKQIKELKRATSQIAGGELAWGDHNAVLTVYAPSYSKLLDNAAVARAALVQTGVVIAPETTGNMSAYFTQLPGNFDWRCHPGALTTRAWADFAHFGAPPNGERKGWWGPPMLRFPTTAQTAYDFVPHVGDVGMAAIFGSTGSGKTALLCTLMAMLDQYMVDAHRRGVIIFYDKDQGGRIFAEACGWNYLIMLAGQPTGAAPLKGFKADTPYARDCIARLVRACILRDGHGPIPPIDEHRIRRGVAAMMRLPVEERSFLRLRQFLGWKDPLGAGPRFERWCRGGPMGWVLDGEEDWINFACDGVGFDFTELLDVPDALEPIHQYLRDRTERELDGRRAAFFMDECEKYAVVDSFAKDITNWVDTFRKRNAFLVFAAQRPDVMLKGSLGKALLTQCQTIWSFAAPTAHPDTYGAAGGLDFTEGEFHAIKEVIRPRDHKVLLKRRGARNQSVILNNDLSPLGPLYINVVSGRKTTIELWNQLAHLPVSERLSAFAEQLHEARD